MDPNPAVIISGIDSESVKQLAPIVQTFLESYSNKPSELPTDDWLRQELRRHLELKTSEEIVHIAEGISQEVKEFSSNLISLNEACEDGETKEAWFAHKLIAFARESNIDTQIFGKHLYEIDKALFVGNELIIRALQSDKSGILELNSKSVINALNIPFNSLYNSNTALNIAKQASVTGVANSALGYGLNLAFTAEDIEGLKKAPIIAKAFYSNDDDDIKKVASAALVVAYEKKLLPPIPSELSTQASVRTLTGITSFGIENVKIFSRLSAGNISSLNALECFARNSITLFTGISCEKIGTGIGASLFSFIPVVGTTVGAVAGGPVGCMIDSEIVNTIKNGVKKIHPIAKAVATATWQTVKSVVSTASNAITSFGKAIGSFFGL
ncbi:MAG: hypothetical protein J5497_07120 [Selenomonadaceae bacterium]|nr:hypothetical protein [Selenomonadaceae bacterium]